jgi:hypothetical protein
MAQFAVASKLKRPRSVTPTTLLGWLQLAGSAVFLSFHAVRAWLTVIIGRLLGKVNRHAGILALGLRVCTSMGRHNERNHSFKCCADTNGPWISITCS